MRPQFDLNGGLGQARADEPIGSVGFEIPTVLVAPTPEVEPAGESARGGPPGGSGSFGRPTKGLRFMMRFRREGVAWVAASVALAAAVSLGAVSVSERGRVSNTEAALARQVSVTRAFRAQLGSATARNGQLDQQVAGLNDRSASLSSELGTCTRAVDVDQQFRAAVNDMMAAKTQGPFNSAAARAQRLYIKSSALQDECLAGADAGTSAL